MTYLLAFQNHKIEKFRYIFIHNEKQIGKASGETAQFGGGVRGSIENRNAVLYRIA
jgi:hypothetical protein